MKVRNEWSVSSHTIGGIQCLQHRDNKQDFTLFGLNGCVYEDGENYRVVFTNNITANTLNRKLLKSQHYSKGEEANIAFDKSMLPEVLKLLQTPKDVKSQLVIANNFGHLTFAQLKLLKVF